MEKDSKWLVYKREMQEKARLKLWLKNGNKGADL